MPENKPQPNSKGPDWSDPNLQVDWDGPSWEDLQAGALADLYESHGSPESSSTEKSTQERRTLREFLNTFGSI